MIRQLYLISLMVTLFSPTAYGYNLVELAGGNKTGEQTCFSCHQSAFKEWQQSDHAKAMAIANSSSILGNFDNQSVYHYGQRARFFIEDNQFQVSISYHDNSETFPIKFTFGHFPLQQYLVETEPGRLQVLPFAWDARPKAQGGQRWYHNYSQEEIRPEDRLHWRQPLQNWNGMCADCHSEGLVRNYDVDKDTFNSQWQGINVGCLSCHGDMSEHSEKQQSVKAEDKRNPLSKPLGQWLRNVGQKTASWHGEKRDNSFMDTCFACHALRSPLTDGFSADNKFLDQFSPQLLSAPSYHADGQIKDEVYVYGSFLQSKMYEAGVNCLDCHEKHTMKLELPGNALCLQCHSSEAYNVKTHHQHEENSTGAQCVNCHMPQNRYMGVDDRRDHSFKIPRPDISAQFGAPNACVKCHSDKDNQWANQALSQWHGEPEILSQTHLNYMKLHSGQAINLQQHLAIIADEQLDIMTRATALQMLPYTTQTISRKQLTPYLKDKTPLLRLAAADTSTLMSIAGRINAVSPMLKDPLKAIRIAAARALLDAQLPPEQLAVFNQAFVELQTTNDISSWRGEGHLNQGMNAYTRGQFKEAEQSFVAAIKVDPYFEAGYINLADFYRVRQQPAQVTSVLTKGMVKLPQSAALVYAYGLHLVRQQQHAKATRYFEKAMVLEPSVEQYIYTYLLSLDGEGETLLALEKLQQLMAKHRDSQQLKELGLYLAQKAGNRQLYDWFNTL